jgi:hypothetical protein
VRPRLRRCVKVAACVAITSGALLAGSPGGLISPTVDNLVAAAGAGPGAGQPGSDRGLHVSVIANGVTGDTALATRAMLEVLGSVDSAGISLLRDYTIELEIIPRGQQLTDLAEFGFLRKRETFDGRTYASLRAVGPTAEGKVVIYAVGAEEVQPSPDSTYGPGFALAHESGHVVRHYGLTAAQDQRLRDLYTAHRDHGGPWLTDYSGSNDDEYFADATAAYFGHPWSASTSDRFSRSWLAANDPQMDALLAAVYAAA